MRNSNLYTSFLRLPLAFLHIRDGIKVLGNLRFTESVSVQGIFKSYELTNMLLAVATPCCYCCNWASQSSETIRAAVLWVITVAEIVPNIQKEQGENSWIWYIKLSINHLVDVPSKQNNRKSQLYAWLYLSCLQVTSLAGGSIAMMKSLEVRLCSNVATFLRYLNIYTAILPCVVFECFWMAEKVFKFLSSVGATVWS